MSAHLGLTIHEHDPVQALAGYDEVDINGFMVDEVIADNIARMPESAAKALFMDLDDILQRDDAEAQLLERTEALSPKDLALYSKLLTIRNSAKLASAIIAASNATAAENPNDIDRMIGEMKKHDVTGEQLGKILGKITHWKTGTAHPTQHLSEEGKHLFRDLLSINNLPVEDRPAAVEAAIKGMFDAKITRDQKMTVREETTSEREQAKLHRKAQRETFWTLKAALEKHYPKDAPNLLDAHIRINMPYHTWCGGGDCDGKPNADKIALLEGMVGFTLDAIEEHLADIEKAVELDPSLESSLASSLSSLKTVKERLSGIENQLYDDHNPLDYDDLKQQFSNVYKNLTIHSSVHGEIRVNCEKDLYENLTIGLRNVAEGCGNDKAKRLLSESLFVMRQYKNTFMSAKIENRAPGPVDFEIMNKLFSDKEFGRVYLEGSMWRSLSNRAFTTLPEEKQREMMEHAREKMRKNPEKAQQHYYRIFPEGLDDKDFPNQLHERGERFELQSQFPDKFGMSIVAEAQKMSPEYQSFLGEGIFRVGHMMHTMLNEDMESLDHAADFVIDFTQNGGKDVFQRAAAYDPRLADFMDRYGAMLPCSDSTKQLGFAALFLQAQALNHLMRYATEKNKTICVKWGNGQVLTRGGGNAHIPGRLKSQAVQWQLNGRTLDPDNDDDMKILANVLFSSNTEQGRAADFMSPNDTRISRNHLRMIGELLGRSLELMGKVKRGTYIKQAAKFSKGARRVFSSIAKDIMMRGYENFRDSNDEKGHRVSDDVAEQISNNKIAGDANQASRPDSKDKKTGNPLYQLRAIGSTGVISHMRTYHDGWMMGGQGMRSAHEAYITREIGDGDLKVFLEDPLWAAMVKNGLRAATLSNLPHAFKELGAEEWSHEKAMRIGKSVEVFPSKNRDKEPPLFTFNDDGEGVTREQAYMAKMYYDQALFFTYVEKFAQLTLDGRPNLPAHGVKLKGIQKALGKIEQASVLHLDSEDGQIGRFQAGEATHELFPFVDQDLNGNRIEMLPSQIVSDVAEKRHDELTQEQRYAVTAAQRSTQTWNNADIYLDQDAYGSRFNKLLKKARMGRFHEMKERLRRMFSANQGHEPSFI